MRRVVLSASALLLVPVVLVGCGREQPASALIGTEAVAEESREDVLSFSGTAMDGSTVDLADLRGRVVVINAWASWCAPCRSEMPAFVDLAASSDPADIAVVGVNVSDDPAAAQAFADELGINFPSVVDREGDILSGIPGVPPKSLPSTVILDREGRIATRIIGPTDSIGLASAIGQVLADEAQP